MLQTATRTEQQAKDCRRSKKCEHRRLLRHNHTHNRNRKPQPQAVVGKPRSSKHVTVVVPPDYKPMPEALRPNVQVRPDAAAVLVSGRADSSAAAAAKLFPSAAERAIYAVYLRSPCSCPVLHARVFWWTENLCKAVPHGRDLAVSGSLPTNSEDTLLRQHTQRRASGSGDAAGRL